MTWLKLIVLFFGELLMVVAGTAQVTANIPQTGVGAGYNPDAVETNNLGLGLGFISMYDDNTFNTVQGNGQGLFSVSPRVTWNINRPRWMSLLDYNGLVSKSSRFDFYDRNSHTFSTTFDYQASKRLSFTANERFIHSVDPLYGGGFIDVTNGNPSFLGTLAVRTTNGIDAEADYRLGAHTDATVGGSFYFQRFSDVPQASFRDSNSAVGRAGFHHAFSPRLTIGSSYDYTKITTPSGYFTVSQRIMGTGEYDFSPNMKLSLFAGPNHVRTSFLFDFFGHLFRVTLANWSWSAGGTYRWTTSKVTMTGTVARQVSDGGGLTGTVRLTSFEYTVERQLPRKFSGSLYARYTLNDRLIPQTGQTNHANYGSVGGEISRKLRRDLTLRLSYDRMEELLGYTSSNPWIDRNRVTISIDYLFTHPLGR